MATILKTTKKDKSTLADLEAVLEELTSYEEDIIEDTLIASFSDDEVLGSLRSKDLFVLLVEKHDQLSGIGHTSFEAKRLK